MKSPSPVIRMSTRPELFLTFSTALKDAWVYGTAFPWRVLLWSCSWIRLWNLFPGACCCRSARAILRVVGFHPSSEAGCAGCSWVGAEPSISGSIPTALRYSLGSCNFLIRNLTQAGVYR